MFFRIKNSHLLLFGIVIFLFAVAFIRSYLALAQTPFANGWDAYYYLVQIKSVFEEGRMHSPDYSLIYPLLLLVKFFVNDFVSAYKISASIVVAAYVLVLFFAAYRIAVEKKLMVAVLVAVCGLFSPTAVFFISQFLKNFLGIVFLLLFIGALTRGKWYIILPLFIITFLTHRMTGVIALIFLFHHYFNKRQWKVFLIFLTIPILASLFIPGALNIFDISRFGGEFQAKPQFAQMSFLEFYGTEKISIIWIAEIIIFTGLWLLFIVKEISFFSLEPDKKIKIAFWVIGFILIFPFFQFNAEGPALRFLLTFLMISPLLLAFIASKIPKYIVWTFCAIFALASIFSYKVYNPKDFDPPYSEYQSLTKSTIAAISRQKTNLVITHKAFAEYFTFTASLDAMPWKPEESKNKDSIIRISCGIEQYEFRENLDSAEMVSIKRIGLRYYLMPEKLWQKFEESANRSNDSLLMQKLHSWENPWQIRPEFITKNRK